VINKAKNVLAALLLLTFVGIMRPSVADAKDAVETAVVPGAVLAPEAEYFTTMNNGNPYSTGTFAVGTIQLFYVVNANRFPSGAFSSFAANMRIKVGPTTGQQTVYPVDSLVLEQIGSKNIVLSPAPASFSVTGQGWAGSSTVGISIDPAVAADPLLNEDGDELVANLRMTTPGGSRLDTVTNIQVHIKLVYPTSCLRLFNFLTDQSFNTLVTSTNVNLGGPANNRKVVGTNPHGQFSDNALVVNDCAQAQTFDLQVNMDPHFDFGPGGANANAVFTFMTNAVVDPSQFNSTNFGTGTAAQKTTFLQNVTLPTGSSFLVKVHMALIKGNAPSWLPANNVFDAFSAQIYTPGTPLNALGTAIPFALAVPNPATTQMGFTVQ
jgi:hypothetical protein